MNPIIRELTINDLRYYKDIRLELLKKHPTNFGSSDEEERLFSHAQWVKRLGNEKTKTIGLFVNQKIVGLSVLLMNPRKKMKHLGSIHSFYVKREFRRNGLAKQMLNYIEKLAIKSGLNRLSLSVVETNKEAIGFYIKNGFIESGKEVDVIHHEGRYYSLIVMSKKIDD